jgi:hypothetical protein
MGSRVSLFKRKGVEKVVGEKEGRVNVGRVI